MNIELPSEKKITVECRVEGGCLGPQGDDYVVGFCDFAKNELSTWEVNLINWEVVPRRDKSFAELQYKMLGRNLSRDQAKKYFELFGKNIDEFESELDETLMVLIDEYMSKQ